MTLGSIFYGTCGLTFCATVIDAAIGGNWGGAAIGVAAVSLAIVFRKTIFARLEPQAKTSVHDRRSR